jgi:hypothetical protein
VKALATGASRKEGESTMSQGTKFTVQLITDGEAKWPYVGGAVVNKNGSINLYLDEGKPVPAGARLYLAQPRKAEAKPE